MKLKETNPHIHERIIKKLKEKHNVSPNEVTECFQNTNTGYPCIDNREEHKTDPQTLWFVGLTNAGRKLKVVFMFINDIAYIKTAYDANKDEIKIFNNYVKKKG